MNWIILLLLFGCWGNCGCGDNRGRDDDCGCGNNRRRGDDCGCGDNRRRGNDCGCRECADAREAVREAKEDVREAIRDVREAKEREQAVCDVPQPWQDYPPMPRRDMDCDNDRNCGCSK